MIGDKLRKLRKEQGLTQYELADALGVTDSYISKVERNGARPGMRFVQNAARVLGVAVDDLLYKPAVARQPDGLVSVRIRSVVNVLTDAQAVELARELMRVATGALCTNCLAKRECNSRHLCGYGNYCPHADRHFPYDLGEKTCTNELPCKLWQQRVGIGVVKSRCRCVEVDGQAGRSARGEKCSSANL